MIIPEDFIERYRAERNKQKKIYTWKFYFLLLLLITAELIFYIAIDLKPAVSAVISGVTVTFFTAFWKSLYEEKE